MSSAATMVSPSFPFQGPPPPPAPSSYNHPPTAGPNHLPPPPPPPSGLRTPPESRRTSGDEAPSVPSTRQSLPSISEALRGPDPGLPFPPSIHQGAPAEHSTSSYFQTPASSSSVAELHRRSVTSGPAIPPAESSHPHPPSHPQSPYMNRGPPPPPVQAPHTPTAQSDPYSRPGYPAQPPKLPSLQPIKTDTSPSSSFRPSVTYASQHPSPAYETPPHTAPGQPPYGYPGYQPGYQYAHPPPPASNPGPLYPASGALGPPRDPPGPNRWDHGHMDERARQGMPMAFHGESVKRHLDEFDFEASLNEIAECSGKTLEFSREYGRTAHGLQRAGPNSRSIPHIHTIDELLQKTKRIEESLQRIREMVHTQNALDQQMKDPGRGGPGGYSDMNGYSDDKQGMGGFAGGDTKKRRGRAAPPGRCHSCNRAETPEWRRGPDGARTLCNACGLHYAKLTRKMGTKAQLGSSNLRPKSEA